MRIVPVAGVAAVDGTGRILLVRRADGAWTHPAGHVEPGENWRQAAEREFAEETGGSVHLHGLLGIYSDPATQVYQYPSGERVQFVGVAFRGTATSIGRPDGTEATEVGWFHLDGLPEPLFQPARPIIADALDGTPQRSAGATDPEQ